VHLLVLLYPCPAKQPRTGPHVQLRGRQRSTHSSLHTSRAGCTGLCLPVCVFALSLLTSARLVCCEMYHAPSSTRYLSPAGERPLRNFPLYHSPAIHRWQMNAVWNSALRRLPPENISLMVGIHRLLFMAREAGPSVDAFFRAAAISCACCSLSWASWSGMTVEGLRMLDWRRLA